MRARRWEGGRTYIDASKEAKTDGMEEDTRGCGPCCLSCERSAAADRERGRRLTTIIQPRQDDSTAA